MGSSITEHLQQQLDEIRANGTVQGGTSHHDAPGRTYPCG